MEEVFKKYQKGMKELLTLLKDNPEAYLKVARLNTQLNENLDSALTFGDTDSLKQDRKPIIDRLNYLTYELLGHSFNKLCSLTEVEITDYRQDFREEVFSLYKSLGFEIIRDFSIDDNRVDFLIHYTMPMKKTYKSLVKTAVSVEDLIGEEIVTRFANILTRAIQDGIANMGELITNLGFTPEARQVAQQHNIQLLTYTECLNTVIDFDRYVDQLIYDYDHHADFANGTRQSFIDILENCDLAKQFIPPKVTDINGATYASVDEFFDTWAKDDARRELIILAEPGYGKTSVLLNLASNLARKYKQEPNSNRIPLIISLKNYGRSLSKQQMITHLLINRYRLNFGSFSAFEMLLRSQKFILLFDGLDEISFENQPAWALENFLELNKLIVAGGKAVITSDTEYLLQQRHAARIFASPDNSENNSSHYEILFLQELDGKQISDFLKSRTQNWQAFYIKIKSIPELLNLAKNPFVLEMMWRHLVQVIREKKPLNTSSFYEVYTKNWFEAEDEESIMSAAERAQFVEELALEMLRKGRLYLHNTEIPPTLREKFQDYLREYSEAEVFGYEVGSCPFLVEDLDGNYKFKHKSLVDFFIAKLYIKKFMAGEIQDFHNLSLPLEVKSFIVELMPKNYEHEEAIRKDMVKIPSGQSTRPFWLDLYPVTNAAYAEFIKATGFERPSHWIDGLIPAGKEKHPVVNISWYDAFLFTKWCGKRLPTEKEWEKASGFEDGRTYSWGNEFNPLSCNSIEFGLLSTTAVDQYPENISPCGCLDMTGNVWELTSSWVDDKRKDLGHVAKGGSFLSDAFSLSSQNRLNYRELNVMLEGAIGFRAAL